MNYDLTQTECERVRQALDKEIFRRVSVPAMARDSRETAPNLARLAKVWFDMSEDERTIVRVAIAQQTGVDAESAWSIDLGEAAELADSGDGRGETVQLPGLRDAVLELYRIWLGRGGDPSIGNRRRSEETGRPPSQVCQFAAANLPIFFPEHFNRIADPTQRVRDAQVKADTQLRALRAASAMS
jgi:hypothetical protein